MKKRPVALPPLRGFHFNPVGIGAWGEALRRHALGHGEALAVMVLGGGRPTPAARHHLADLCRKAPRRRGRVSNEIDRATVEPASPNAWSAAVELHAAGNRHELARMVEHGADIPVVARDAVAAAAAVSRRTVKRPMIADAINELGTVESARRLYAERNASPERDAIRKAHSRAKSAIRSELGQRRDTHGEAIERVWGAGIGPTWTQIRKAVEPSRRRRRGLPKR